MYLGFTFATSMGLQESAKQLTLKGRRALFDVIILHSRLEQMTRNSFFKIFDTKIQLILLCSSEVCVVLVKDKIPTASVHLFCLQEISQRDSPHTKQNGVWRAWSAPSADQLLHQSDQVLVPLIEDGL